MSQSQASLSPFHHTPQSQNPPLSCPGGHQAQGELRPGGCCGVGCALGRMAKAYWTLGIRACLPPMALLALPQ